MLENCSIEVCVIPANPHCLRVGDVRKAVSAPGASVLGCLSEGGSLVVWDPTNRDCAPAKVEGEYADFSWECPLPPGRTVNRLLTVGSHFGLKILQLETEPSQPISVVCVCECTADSLLQRLRDKDEGVCELTSLSVLSFAIGRCFVLLNCDWLIELQTEEEAGLKISACFNVQSKASNRQPSVSHCVCGETLFILSATGTISVCNLSDGAPLASIDLPSYLSGDITHDITHDIIDYDLTATPSTSSFVLLQVSADLSTAVAVTHSHTAVAVDLHHYFSVYPAHLLCGSPPSLPPLQPQKHTDQDSLASSTHSLSALEANFTTDSSWESRLASMYSQAQQPAASSQPLHSAWPPVSTPQTHTHSPVPPGGSTVNFSVAESCAPSLLTVSEYSAQLAFVAPGNTHSSVALWEFESGSVSYHQTEGPAAPVLRCGETHRLMLKDSGVFLVLFSVSQQDLLSRLMLFGSAATVDAVCLLNAWGRCNIPIHSLKAGLKNRQLDTVDFFLKSKENILNPEADQPTGSAVNLTDSVQELCPALDLLCSAVRESHSEATSRQFSEQLLNITMTFVNSLIRSVLSYTQYEEPAVQQCVCVLDGYVSELRTYMKRFPWPVGGDSCSTHSTQSAESTGAAEEERDAWEQLTTEEVVRVSVLTNQIPRAQFVLRGRGQWDRLSGLREAGLRQVYGCLQDKDLKTANTMLTNMGYSVKQQLHSICLYTDSHQLRDYVVEELSGCRYLAEEELQSVEFIREMERLGSLPSLRCDADTSSQPHRPVQSVRMASDVSVSSETILGDLIGREQSPECHITLWRKLKLDWVRHWDQSRQTDILLSRLKHTELPSCEPGLLWHYLTAFHDQRQVVEWISVNDDTIGLNGKEGSIDLNEKEGSIGLNGKEGSIDVNGAGISGAPVWMTEGSVGTAQWPELTPQLVNSNTACSTFMRENILDLLARRGVYIPDELSDLGLLLWRLAQGGGVMTSSAPPLPQYHSLFITHCLEQGLKYLLYAYLDYYRLTPRNLSLLTNQSLSQSQPWFDMMVKIQEITKDLTDPSLLFHASLTSAQVLLPGSQPSLSSLLLEGHSQLALAAVMFSPGGIDQVVEGSDPFVDPELLKMALTPYPKLRSALFPSGSHSDVSVYHLMQSLHPLDPSRLFGWQNANTLNSTDCSELPHFSSPALVKPFALLESLDYLFYLRHGRPSFAYATFITQQLRDCGDVATLLHQALQQVYCLALQSFNLPSVSSACVLFCELIGVCSLKLRVDIKALNMILQHIHTAEHTLVSKGVRLAGAEPGAAEDLIGSLEAAVTDSVEQKGFGRSSYEASLDWSLPVQFCQLHSLTLSSVFPSHCAADRQFIHFLLFVQLHSYPPRQVRSLAEQFAPALQSHLSLAFQDLQVYNQRGTGVVCETNPRVCVSGLLSVCASGCVCGFGYVCERQKVSVPPKVCVSGSGSVCVSGSVCEGQSVCVGSEQPREMFQALLQSQEESSPCRFLLHEAMVQRCPTLAVMAACTQPVELVPCLCVWVLTSVDDITASEAASHLADAPQHHQWNLHDLSIIWRTLLQRGHVRTLLRGFQLFMKDCPLLLALRMFQLCSDFRNFTEAKAKLLDFQRVIIAQRSVSLSPPCGLPLQWTESAASVLLLTLLQSRMSPHHLHRLLLMLAESDKLLKSNGPDFRSLSALSELLQGTGVCVSAGLLQCTSPSDLQGHYQAAVDALQERGLYDRARKVAELGGLSVQQLLLSQLLQEVTCQGSKRQWSRLDTRVSFWMRCHQQLSSDNTDPESASHFFMSHCNKDTQTQLVDVQNHCLLLSLAAKWLSKLHPAPLDRLEDLEKQLWVGKIQRHILGAENAKEGVFKLPSQANISPEMTAYDVAMKEFSFASISALNTEKCLSLEGLPDSSEHSPLSEEERGVMVDLVGQLLDDGSIHEACRISRYFLLHHKDLRLVLRCRGLASGELEPETQEETTEKTIKSSPSVSSLSSFVMLPSHDDDITVQLRNLVTQCRHGNSYCKQVLGLYQLSKELDVPFLSVCSEEPVCVLEKLLLSEQTDRLRKAQVFIKAQGLTADCVAEMVSTALIHSLLAHTQEMHTVEKQIFRPCEGRDSLVQLIKLCDDPNLVGNKVLEKLTTVQLRDLGCIVELLIVAHDCFSLTCNTEGIVRVLQAARHLSHAHLAPGEQYSLLVRLLTGIGRYNEMTYVFDLLHQNHRFEMLLRKKVDTDRGQSSSLKTALLDYLKRCLPGDSEKHNMVALCYSMRREIGENHEIAARTQLKIIQSQAWVVTPELKSSLVKVLGLLKDAAESFSKDSCVRQASRCVLTAKLVALQLHFLNQGSEVRVINLQPSELLTAVTALPRCYQAFVLCSAYSFSPDWSEVLFQRVVLNGDFLYLDDFKRHRPLTTSLFEDIFKKLDGAPSSVTPNIKRLLSHCDDAYSRYRLAYQHNLYDVTKTLLQDANTSGYLTDRLAS